MFSQGVCLPPCIPGKTDCPYWVSSKYRASSESSEEAQQKEHPERCYEGKPDGDHNCIVARFTPPLSYPPREKAPRCIAMEDGFEEEAFGLLQYRPQVIVFGGVYGARDLDRMDHG